MKFYLFI